MVLDGEAEALTRRCIDLALEGDATALRLCIDRLCPPSRSRPVTIDLPRLDGASSIAEAHVRVVEALAAGELDPDTAATVIGVLTRTRDSYELTNIEARLAALEESEKKRQ